MITVKIHVPTHYAWGNDDNPAVPKDRKEYRPYLVAREGSCCLGFAGRSLGLSDENMDGHEEPADCRQWMTDNVFVEYDENEDRATADFAQECMDINDAAGETKWHNMPYKERMEALKKLGLRHGVDFQLTWEEEA